MPKLDPFKTVDGKPISNAIEKWDHLSDRDFAVASCAVIDANLTHLLQQRLADLPDIVENYLGLGDRVEGGTSTLSAKVELAALVGLITAEDVRYLKALARIRNHFAHRVVMDFTSECIVKELAKLKCLIEENTNVRKWKNDAQPGVQRLYREVVEDGINKIGKTNQAGRTILSWSRVLFEVLFWQIDAKNERVKTLQRLKPPQLAI